MSSSPAFPAELNRRPDSIIWLGDVDPDGYPIHPLIKALAYAKEREFIRYRAKEMTDKALVASLIEKAAHSASKVAFVKPLSRPGYYLYRTYVNLVDKTLRETVEAFNMESYLLDRIVSPENRNLVEETTLQRLTRQKVFDSMDAKGRGLWNRHLLGFDTDELADEEGQTADYIGMRLRRAIQQAVRRLVPGGQ
jgi:uncharacterized NAD(P)/FAD-binding protein YdhS